MTSEDILIPAPFATEADEIPPEWGPAPIGKWGPDILGPGFLSQTLPLGADDEGPLVATIVKHDPQADKQAIATPAKKLTFALLYIHGWNDYYFQRETARHVSAAGGAFYAMDLEKFGRSIRPGQTFGWTTDLNDYDRDFAAAIEVIRTEHPNLPLLIMGHSMGGLITTLWTGHHPGESDGLILNSPWLSHFSDSVTAAVADIRGLVHGHTPDKIARAALPLPESDIYARCLGPWDPAEVPASLEQWRDDPSIKGWTLEAYWKRPVGRHMRYGWMGAIATGQNEIASGLRLEVPVLLTLSTATPTSSTWNPLMHIQDVVLDVNAIMRHGPHLSESVTIERFYGLHDLVLSIPPVRKEFWQKFHAWLRTEGFETEAVYAGLGEAGRTKICP